MSGLVWARGRNNVDIGAVVEPNDLVIGHEALLYAGVEEFLDQTVPFVEAGLAAHEPVMVAVPRVRLDALRARLGAHAAEVLLVDMEDIGTNPARIIPAWRDFIDTHSDRRGGLRGIGEPVWAGRSNDELVECQHHESLLNVVLADVPDMYLLCAYDTQALPEAVIEEALHSHPTLVHEGRHYRSPRYEPPGAHLGPLAQPLRECDVAPEELMFSEDDLASVRRLVAERAARARLAPERAEGLVLAAHEIASNSVRHGGGQGRILVWEDDQALVCEVRDAGHIREALAGRVRPPRDTMGGRGLWIANQLCDLVQIRSGRAGSAIRLHMRTKARGRALAAPGEVDSLGR
jgi:anti-sigma regulatory factor (Ser/Thr protein kinase)